jgi:hypothetical protein
MQYLPAANLCELMTPPASSAMADKTRTIDKEKELSGLKRVRFNLKAKAMKGVESFSLRYLCGG